MIIAIVAMTKDRVIGLDGKIPWDVKEDLSLFKKKTINNVVIMGRKTYESIGKPLPNRINIVISSDKGYKAGDAVVCNSIEQGLEFAKKIINKDIYIIGGSTIYRQCMKYIDKICVSYIKKDYKGDTFFLDSFEKEFDKISEESFEEFIYVEYLRKTLCINN